MQSVLLAIDDVSLPFRKNVCLHLIKPSVRKEPVLAPSEHGCGAPDDSAAHFYGTVLHDEGKFRMWYYACHWGENPDWPDRMKQQIAKPPPWASASCEVFQGPICYAESEDGITWTKPNLGQVLFKGNRDNNAIDLPHAIVVSPNVIKDEDDPDPARRYKMVYQYFPDQSDPQIEEYGGVPTVALAVSPDGLRWAIIGIPFVWQFLEPSSFIKHNAKFFLHYHVMDSWSGWLAEGGTACGRVGVVRTTSDFTRWPDLVAGAFALAEPEDVSLRGMSGPYDQVHLGVGAFSLGNVCVGLYGLWHNADFNTGFNEISCDFGLLISNDGMQFREPVKGHRYLRREDSLVTPVPGHDFHTVLCQANGILNVGDETRIYHGRWRNVGANGNEVDMKYYSGEVALATLPRDRWGALALNPGVPSGTICSAMMEVKPDADLRVNADFAAGLSVDLLDEDFQPIAGYQGGKVSGPDGLSCAVSWEGKDLTQLTDRNVRIQLSLKRDGQNAPKVYALYL